MVTKRFQHREDDFSAGRIDGQSFEVVETSVRCLVILLIQAVEVHHAQQLLAFDRTFVQILHVRADGVVTIGDV